MVQITLKQMKMINTLLHRNYSSYLPLLTRTTKRGELIQVPASLTDSQLSSLDIKSASQIISALLRDNFPEAKNLIESKTSFRFKFYNE